MASDVETLSYRSGTADVDARLHRPPATVGRAPAVLLAPGLTRDIDALAFFGRALADRGCVVLGTTYRGPDLLDDDDDCIAGLDHLVGLDGVDADRLAVVGHSRGAMAALRLAARDPRIRAAVALEPVTDFVRYVRATKDYAPTRYAMLTQRFGGEPDERPEPYERYAAINYAKDITVPVLLMAGTADLHSPADHSVWMRDALVAAGNPDVELRVIDGMGHFFDRMYAGYAHDEVADLVVDWLVPRLAG